VKRNKASKAIYVIFISILMVTLSSCSSLWLHRDQTVDSALQEGVKTPQSSVPKEQYDELARKYQELLKQTKNIKTNEPEKTNLPEVPTLVENTVLDPSELVNKIDTAIPDAKSADGVDAISNNPVHAGPTPPTSMGVKTVNHTDDIDGQITRLREAQEAIKVNKFETALVTLKDLENSEERQIAVRAKMMLGDLLFNQGEFDLASQVYEEIITKHAFSGFVLKALGKLVACSEKLKQPEKQAKYYSLLHDFFEAT
jgi:TolA-binding protein